MNTPAPRLLGCLSAMLLLAGCGSSPGGASSGLAGATSAAPYTYVPPAAPPDYTGTTNTVPATPTSGSRAGQVYNVYIQAPTGDKVAFTVFEPATLAAGQTYPLVIHGHGFGASRQTSTDASTCQQCAIGLDVPVGQYVSAGYGVISFDQRGFGESTGKIRVMDPDAEGQDALAILDWAEARLNWLAYGPSADGSDPHNLIVGSIGGSYGGMYQYMLHNIDPRHRLDAMVPQFAPNDLNFSLFPGGVPKTLWNVFLFGIGNNPQGGGFDPYVSNGFTSDFAADAEDSGFHDFFYYHSNQYFYGGHAVATNGGAGTAPMHAPLPGPKVNALLFQGVRDTLFNFSEGFANYQALKALGGDVRLLSYQKGHNTFPIVPDTGNTAYFPSGNNMDSSCGGTNADTAALAFFDEYLKGHAGAASKAIPQQPCLSIAKGDAVLVPQVMTAQTGGETRVAVPATTVVAGGTVDAPVSVDLGITGAATSAGTVVAGIPHLTVTVAPSVAGTPGAPTIFVGLGQTHASQGGTAYDLINNQVLPLHGTGSFDVDLVGVAARLGSGDKLALLIYGLQDQFAATGGVNLGSPAVLPVTVSGTVQVPVLAAGGYTQAP